MRWPWGRVSRSSAFGGRVEGLILSSTGGYVIMSSTNAVDKQGIAREDQNMPGIGAPELLIVLVIVIIIFGVGRIGKVGKELGTGIREFRKGVSGDEEKSAASEDKPKS